MRSRLKLSQGRLSKRRTLRRLYVEGLEQRWLMAIDVGDTISQSTSLGIVSTTPRVTTSELLPDTDVDMFAIAVSAGQVVDFDIDTTANGPGGLGSYLRLFNSLGQQLASNNDAIAPGEATLGFDAYLRFTFTTAGNYYLGVSNAGNTTYNPITGTGDIAGAANGTGAYRLTVQALPVDTDDQLSEAVSFGAILATPITRTSTISTDIDVDMYRFSASAGQVIDFNINTPTNGPGGLDSYLRIFDSQGVQLAVNNDALAPGENVLGFDAYLRFRFAAGGTYYVAVSNANNTNFNAVSGAGDSAGGFDSIGSYTLIAQAIPEDTDDAISEAISLGTITTQPVTRSSSISTDIDVDMYSFSVAAGQVVDFDIDTATNGPDGLGSYLRLFNAQGQQLASNNDAAAPGETTVGFDAYLRFTFTTAGTYYIAVSNYNNTTYNPVTGANDSAGGQYSTGAYQLIVQTPAAAPVDPDDTISEASSLGAISTTPKTVDSTISPDTDVDMYAISVSAGQVIDFDIDTTANGPGGLGSYLRLFNSLGQQLASNNDAIAPGEATLGFDAYLRFTFTTAGNYYLGVSNAGNTTYDPITGTGDVAGAANGTGAYRLTVQALPVDTDDQISEAVSLGAISLTPVSRSSTISTDIDVDMYRFDVSDGQVVDFDIDTPTNGPGGLDSYLRVFNAQGVMLAFNDDAAAPGDVTAGFDAYLRFRFTAGGTYYVAVSNANNTNFNAVSGAGDTAGGFDSIGSYTLIAQAIPEDTDDAISEAISLGTITTQPVTRSSSISTDIDVDMYSFSVAAGQVVDFDIDTATNGPDGLGSYLRLFNAQGQQLASNNDAAAPGETTVGFDAYLRFTFTTAGTYYIAVSNYNNTTYNPVTGANDSAGGQYSTGAYQLIVQTPAAAPVDPDDTISEASSLGAISTTPKTVDSTISPDTDVDMYAISVSAGQVIDFDIDTTANGPGGLGSYLRLFNSLGQQLASNDDAIAPGEVAIGFDAYLRFTFTTAGNYYLGVSNAGNTTYDPITGTGDVAGAANGTGAYRLTVQALPVDTDDQISEAVSLGTISLTPVSRSSTISTDIDVDMYRFDVSDGQVVDFDIDTPTNGPGGLDSYLRLFNAQGVQIAINNDAAAAGETAGFDAYLRHTFVTGGTYYIGVSNANNRAYNPNTGGGDTAGGINTLGPYQLTVQALPPVSSAALAMTISASSIPEEGGQATVTLSRSGGDATQVLTVTLTSGDPASATVPASVVFNANVTSTTFLITAVHSTTLGTRQVTITATASGYSAASRTITITDSDSTFHNAANPPDVNNDGVVSPLDALLVINYLNTIGPGPIPQGSPPPYYDVNGDNFISSIDALLVINALNAKGTGEGESVLAPPADQFKRAWADAVDGIFAQEPIELRQSLGS